MLNTFNRYALEHRLICSIIHFVVTDEKSVRRYVGTTHFLTLWVSVVIVLRRQCAIIIRSPLIVVELALIPCICDAAYAPLPADDGGTGLPG